MKTAPPKSPRAFSLCKRYRYFHMGRQVAYHEMVDRGALEHGRSNTVENCFSIPSRGLTGVYYSVSEVAEQGAGVGPRSLRSQSVFFFRLK